MPAFVAAVIRDLANAMGEDWLDSAGNLEPQPAIFPDGVAPVVRATPSGGLELLKMRWGFPSPEPKPGDKKKSGYQTNIRQPRWKQCLAWMASALNRFYQGDDFCLASDGSNLSMGDGDCGARLRIRDLDVSQ